MGFLIQALVAIPVRLLRLFVVVRLVRFHTPFGFVLRFAICSVERQSERQGVKDSLTWCFGRAHVPTLH